MILSEHVMHHDKNKIRVYPIGDLHITLKHFRMKRFQDYIKTIQEDKAAVAFLLGDMTDARHHTHKYFEPEIIHSKYRIEDLETIEYMAAEELAELLTPIANKIGGILRGNHTHPGFIRNLLYELHKQTNTNIPNLGDRAMTRLKILRPKTNVTEKIITIFLVHQDSPSRNPGTQINRQHQRMTYIQAHLYLSAHTHRSSIHMPPTYHLQHKGKLKLIRTNPLHINAGTFLNPLPTGITTYADTKDLPPPNDQQIIAEITIKSNTKQQNLIINPKIWQG